MTCRVSVLVPTYNYGRYLQEALNSVLRQTFTDFEILVSDDASSDDSAEIIKDYAERDARIRYHIQAPNLGMAANWNWCLENAQGEYIRFLFGDDFLFSPDALRLMVEAMDRDSALALTTSARMTVSGDSVPVRVWDDLKNEGKYPGQELLLRCLLANRNLIGEPSAVMFRRSAATGAFNADYRQLIDLEFWLRLLENGALYYFNKPLCAFRVHAAQQTSVNRQSRHGEHEAVSILVKYLPVLRGHAARHGPHDVRETLFRSLRYVRKGRAGSQNSHGDEATLMRELTPFWFRVYWLRHKLIKPFLNIARAFRKRAETLPTSR